MTDDNVAATLARIIDALSRLRRIVLLKRLRPGRESISIRRALAARGLSVPSGLVELFGSYDGTDTSGDVTLDELQLFPGFYLLSLSDAVCNYDAFKEDARWDRAWLPVFANGGGDFYAVVCDDGRECFGAIVRFWIEQSDHPIEFASLPAMLQTLAAAFDQSIFYVDTNGYLEMDDSKFAALAASLNPDVAYWSE